MGAVVIRFSLSPMTLATYALFILGLTLAEDNRTTKLHCFKPGLDLISQLKVDSSDPFF